MKDDQPRTNNMMFKTRHESTHHMENTWETGISHLQTQKEEIRGGRAKGETKIT